MWHSVLIMQYNIRNQLPDKTRKWLVKLYSAPTDFWGNRAGCVGMLYVTVAKLNKSDLCLKGTNPTAGRHRGALNPPENHNRMQNAPACACLSRGKEPSSLSPGLPLGLFEWTSREQSCFSKNRIFHLLNPCTQVEVYRMHYSTFFFFFFKCSDRHCKSFTKLFARSSEGIH